MEFFLGGCSKLEQPLSPRGRTSSSKRGIVVTLSKQKSTHSKQQNSTQKYNIQNSSVNSVGSQIRAYQTQCNLSGREHLRSNQTQIMRFSDQQSIQSDLISSYFEKNHLKQCAKKESVVLDQQIRKLQFQIYNTRTKITEAKYLTKKQSQNKLYLSVKNSRKSKQKIEQEEIQHKRNKSTKNKSNPNLAMKSSHKLVEENIYSTGVNHTQLNNRSPISIIQNKSPTQFINSQERSRSRSPSPPHPSFLRQLLLSTKKTNIKHKKIHQNVSEFNRKESSLTEQTTNKFHYNSCDFADQIYYQKPKSNKQSERLELYSIHDQQKSKKNIKDQCNPQSYKIKSSKQQKKTSNKKSSMSAYSSNHVSKVKQLSKSREKFVKRKSKVSDFHIDLQMYLKKGKKGKKQKNINLFHSEIQDRKQSNKKMTKKGLFTNQILTKTSKFDTKNTAKIKHIEEEQKLIEKRKKSKRNEDKIEKGLSNQIVQNNKIHQVFNNSSRHSTVKSKYIKGKSSFY